MKWRSRKLVTANADGQYFQGSKLATKQSFIVRFGSRLGQGIATAAKRKSAYVEIICALYIILFIYTGVNKMMDIEKFKYEMGRSPFIQNMGSFIAYSLPVGELLLALLLIIKRTRLVGLYLSFTLMALFTGYIWLMLNYAWDLPCSCGGILASMTWQQHLLFNACFTALGLTAIVLQTISKRPNKST
jgi:uncharacterized membrane protein YphA (DoxX/SURF4 family)